MSLFDYVPSMKAVTVSRSFDARYWTIPLRCDGDDILARERSVYAECRRRKEAFYLDPAGDPICQSLCPPSLWFPTLVGRITHADIGSAGSRSGLRATLHVAATLPLDSAIVDIAFPGAHLAGARMADVTVIDTPGHRRTVHSELPPGIVTAAPIMLALRPVTAHRAATPAAATVPVSAS